jgi:hypothetical protein
VCCVCKTWNRIAQDLWKSLTEEIIYDSIVGDNSKQRHDKARRFLMQLESNFSVDGGDAIRGAKDKNNYHHALTDWKETLRHLTTIPPKESDTQSKWTPLLLFIWFVMGKIIMLIMSIVVSCVVLRCCVVEFCVALCCVVLCCVALRCVALSCVALRCVALCCVALWYVVVLVNSKLTLLYFFFFVFFKRRCGWR